MKALIDLILVATFLSFEAGRKDRPTEDVGRARHPSAPRAGTGAFLPVDSSVPDDSGRGGPRLESSVGFEQARMFLDPILGGAVPDDVTWDPFRQTW
jgi:hypothetical protein